MRVVQFKRILPWFILLSVGLLAVFELAIAPRNVAQAIPATCNVSIVVDRSASVDINPAIVPKNSDVLKAQIKNLFGPSGIADNTINLAFWSFSDTVNPGPGYNYNAPYYGQFVSSAIGSTAFNNSVDSISVAGGTNYEQGFGFNKGVLNPALADTIRDTDIIVFMTDGIPNAPTVNDLPGSDDDPYAIGKAQQAVGYLKNGTNGAGKSKIIIGAVIGSAPLDSLSRVINGDPANHNDIVKITPTYVDLASLLTEKIQNKCHPYSLTPQVSVANGASYLSGDESAIVKYDVTNDSPSGRKSDLANWSVKEFILPPGVSADPLYFSGDPKPYRDDYSCGLLSGLLSGVLSGLFGGTLCNEIAHGSGEFPAGSTSLGDTTVQVSGKPVGTKFCYVLTVDKPTESVTPVNRYSSAKCLTVGARPTVQIRGGDLRVGRHFKTDTDQGSGVSSTVQAYTATEVDGAGTHTYGSWAEYGVFSPGVVVGFASSSGFAGGTLLNTQDNWSKLTFANCDDDYPTCTSNSSRYGFFQSDNASMGKIPDVVGALLGNKSVDNGTSLNSLGSLGIGSIADGLNKKDDGNFNLDGGTLGKGRSVIIYVPNHTVTITDNINYDNGDTDTNGDGVVDGYTDISQIPQLIIIAKNIVIGEDVSNVDAWLIADNEPDGTDPSGGIVNTCNNGTAPARQICYQKSLTVNGPVMASKLQLHRMGGSGSGAPAEIINLPGTAYLWIHNQGQGNVRAQTALTTELPPYF